MRVRTCRAYDPEAMEKAKAMHSRNYVLRGSLTRPPKVQMPFSIVTEWDEFRQVDWTRLLSMVEQPLVIDGRNTFSPEEISRNGFRYVSIGRVDALPCQPAAEKSGPFVSRHGQKRLRSPGLIRSKQRNSDMNFRLDRLATLYLVSPFLRLAPGREPSIPILMYHSISIRGRVQRSRVLSDEDLPGNVCRADEVPARAADTEPAAQRRRFNSCEQTPRTNSWSSLSTTATGTSIITRFPY